MHFPVATTADYIGTYSALDSGEISKANSAYTEYGTNIYSYHHGTEYYALDISGTGANAGAEVYAVADGIVVDWREGYGQITLKHGGLTLLDGTTYYSTWYSTYVHMKVEDVKSHLGNNPIGKKVDCGDPIGTVWNTSPGSVGFHLHFSMTTEINPITGGSFHYRDRRNNAPNDANTILHYARKTLSPRWVFEIMNNKQIKVDWGVADNGQADLKARFQRGTEYAPGNSKNATLFGGSAGGSTTPSSSMTPAEYLALPSVTYTNMSVQARPKNSGSLQVWKLPWTNASNGVQDASLKLTTVSGTFQITKKVQNHAGNTWYECKIGSGTVGYVYSNEITLLPYASGADVTNKSADTAKLVVTWKNPGGVTLLKGGFILMNSSGGVLKSVTDNVPQSYQTALDLPCSYEMKTKYQYPLQSNTTYTYTMFVIDSSNVQYEVSGKFTTDAIPVTGVSVSPATATVNIGKTQQLTASVTPSNASNKNVTWKSSNTSVATVSASGVVTAKAIGTATITATAADGSGKSSTATITVTCDHSSGTVTLPAVEPTCMDSGLTAGKKCSACGTVTQAQTIIPATGEHTFEREVAEDRYLVSAATCTAKAVYWKSCSVCGEKGTETFTLSTADMKDHTFADNVCACGAVRICEDTFPDANFRTYIQAQDYGADGVLTNEELSIVTSIDVGEMNIKDLTGIEYFNTLMYLYCDSNQLTELDVSKNIALKYLNCEFNNLAALNVSKNTALTVLYCYHNQLTELDVSKNTALMDLHCISNQLKTLDVSKNTALSRLWCDDNQLTELDVSKNNALTGLWCAINQLTELDVSKNTALEYLFCDSNQLTKLNVSKNTALLYMGCSSNQLSTLDVRKNTALQYLVCSDNLCTVTTTQNRFDLSSLDGFDVSKASNWQGGTVSGNILTATSDTVTYIYDMGNGYKETFTLKVKNGFAITKHPTSVNLKTGSTATFKVVTTGTNLTYQWQYKDPAVGTWYNSGMTGNKTANLQVGAIVARHNFQYRCKITDGNGNVAYSNAATLTVFGIKTQPSSATAKQNENVNFKVVATGTGLTYQWQYKNPSVGTWYNSEMTGSKTSVMTVEAIAFRNNFQYRCKITDGNGNVIYTNAATLTVKSGPSITTQPTSTYLKTGSTAKFKVVATGTNLTYQWQYKDPSVGTWYSSTLTGNKTSTIQVGATVGRNNFQYRCKVTDGSGNVVYSNAATLTVFGIKTQPASATAKLNENVNFKVIATGTGLTYQWQYKDPSVGTWYNSGMTGNKTSVMTVEAIAFRNNFQYRCKITDSKGNVIYTNAVTLTVKSGPSITTQPTSTYLKTGNTAKFKVVATGTNLTYQWQYKDPAVGTWYSSTLTGNKTSTIQVGATVGRNNFQYRCKITDGNGNVAYSNAATLTVFGIKIQPASTTANLSENVNFKVIATGTGLTYQWQWRKDSSSTWAATTVGSNKTATITVPATTARNGYQYRCKITDSKGNVIYTNAATLTVKSGPSITTQPTSTYLKTGNTAKFKVVATGTNLTYQWQYKDPSVGTWYSSTLTGNKTSTIQVGATVGRNNFQYRCKITDGNGNVVYSNAATLTVFGIKTQPASATAKLNENVNFKVIATGTGLTYQWQWRKDSSSTWAATTVSGNKTATITVPATTARNGYQYRCKITDSKGNVIYTNAVKLTVK